MHLMEGQFAPHFATEDIYGQPISLDQYQGKKLMMCFYRYAGCPMCNFYLSILISRYSHFASHGLEVLAFFQSPKKAVLEYPGLQKPPFPLIADPHKEIYNIFGVEASYKKFFQPKTVGAFYSATVKEHYHQDTVDGDFFLMPAEFLIGPPHATIYKAHYWQNVADALSMEDIEHSLIAMDKAAPASINAPDTHAKVSA